MNNSNSNNSNRDDNVYSAIIITQPLHQFTQFISTVPGGCLPLDQANRLEPETTYRQL